MGLEERNGNYYYYRKNRIGDRVESEYCGKGEIALLMENLDCLERQKQEMEQIKVKTDRAALEAIDAELETISKFNKDLVTALFLTRGYHQHKGQWRKKR